MFQVTNNLDLLFTNERGPFRYMRQLKDNLTYVSMMMAMKSERIT